MKWSFQKCLSFIKVSKESRESYSYSHIDNFYEGRHLVTTPHSRVCGNCRKYEKVCSITFHDTVHRSFLQKFGRSFYVTRPKDWLLTSNSFLIVINKQLQIFRWVFSFTCWHDFAIKLRLFSSLQWISFNTSYYLLSYVLSIFRFSMWLTYCTTLAEKLINNYVYLN